MEKRSKKYIHIYTECENCNEFGMVFASERGVEYPVICNKCWGKKATEELITLDEFKELLEREDKGDAYGI